MEQEKHKRTESVEPVEEKAETTQITREQLLKPVPDDGIVRRWYALHVLTAKEYEVCDKLLKLAKQRGMENLVVNAFVPKQKVAEVRGGVQKVKEQKCFPGYILVQLPEHPEKYPELWSMIKEVPGVTGFVSSRRNAPTPLSDEEVEEIISIMVGEQEPPKPKLEFAVGDKVKIVEGPFANFTGVIEEINQERGTMKVSVEIFNRATTIEVETWQAEIF